VLWIYQFVFPILAAGILLKIVFAGRGRALREGRGELRQRLGLVEPRAVASLRETPEERLVWFHAASVGEVLAATPLLKALAAEANAPRILMTTTTVAGRDKALGVAEVDAALLAPMDFYPAIRTFLRRVRPDALILVETELWPMTLRCAADAGIAIGLANGRMRERSFRRYSRLSGFFRPLLAPFARAAVQDENAAKRFAALGVSESALRVTGNVKYDQLPPAPAAVEAARARLRALGWGEDPVWIAGSTRRGEEPVLCTAHTLAAERIPSLRWILAPRHPERVREAERFLREAGIRFTRWSEPLAAEKNPSCLLIDELGVLPALYPCARTAFVGGTLVEIGGHNVLEPAVSGVPVLFGPHIGSVREVAEGLTASGGGRVVCDAAQTAAALLAWVLPGEEHDRAVAGAANAAETFSGAAARTLAHLRPLLLL